MSRIHPRFLFFLTLCMLMTLTAAPVAWPQQALDEDCQLCCCLGDLAQAQTYATQVAKLIPGVDLKIEPTQVKSSKGVTTVFSIYATHPEMSLEEICSLLADKMTTPCLTPATGQ